MTHTPERADLGFTDPRKAFDRAIAMGILSAAEESEHFAGGFMYMGDEDGHHMFKNRNTRAYIRVRLPA